MEKSLEKVYKSALKFLRPLSLQATYKIIVSEAIKIVGGDYGSISMVKRRHLERAYASSATLFNIEPRKKGYTYSVYKNSRGIILERKKLTSVHPTLAKLHVKSDILIPLVNRNESIGVLTVLSRKKVFKKRDLSILQLFGPLATLAIRKAQLYDELDKALNTRDLFISMASHELRTPLTTAYTYLQLQKRRLEKGGKIEEEWIDITINELLRLNNLVDGLLQLNQIKVGKIGYNFLELTLKDVMLTSIRSFKALHKRRKIELEDGTKEKDIVLGDFEKLTQVFVNVLDNSAKYSPSNSVISIKLFATKKNVNAEVQDRGSGFNKKDVKRVFDAFFKVENNTKSGMGLGLYLTKQIMEDHRGKISIDSEKGKGTIVKMKLPKVRYD